MAFKKSLCQMHQGFLSGIFLTLMLLTPSAKVLAEGGHGGSEFQGSGEASQMTKPSPINASIAEQMGIKVELVTLQRLAIGIRATGQIETLPNRRVDVTTPVGGTVIKLPLQYCNKLNKV